MKRLKKNVKRGLLGVISVFSVIALGVTFANRSDAPSQTAGMESEKYHVPKSNNMVLSVVPDQDQELKQKLESAQIPYTQISEGNYLVEAENLDVFQNDFMNDSDSNYSISDDTPFVICSDEETEPEEIDEQISLKEDLPEGYTWKMLAQERGQKLIAVIDTGVNNYAVGSVDFTGEGIEDESGHGTFIAKTILDHADGKAVILSVKAMQKDGVGYMSSIMQAVQYAKDQGADIINMSFITDAGEGKEAFVQLIKDVMADGITVVAAAGNLQSDVRYYLPAGIEGVISVGAVDEEGKKAVSSNYGDVTYYEQAVSTSQASAIVSGKLAAETDLSENITKDTVVIEEGTTVDEPVRVVEEDEEDGFEIVKIQGGTNKIIFAFNQGCGTRESLGYYASFSVGNKVSFNNGSYTGKPANSWGVWDTITLPNPTGYTNSKWKIGGVSGYSGSLDPAGKTFTYSSTPGGIVWEGTVVYIECTWESGTPIAKKYTLTIDPNGGKLSGTNFGSSNGTTNTASVTVTEKKDDYSVLGTATRTNYTFLGFYTAKTGGTQVFGANGKAVPGTSYWNSSSQWIYGGNLTVYAQWQAITKTVTVKPSPGSWNGTTSNSTVTQAIGSTLNVTPSSPKYTVSFDSAGGTSCSNMTSYPTFAGWTVTGGGSVDSSNVYKFGDTDGTLTAKWTNNSITLPTPTRTGYSFQGWTSNGTNTLKGSYTVSGSVKLTAKWKINSYTVTFVNGLGTTLSTQSIVHGKNATPPSDPTRTGYRFNGWNGTYTNVTSTRTITAKWVANTYTVVFNSNGTRHVSNGVSAVISSETTQRVSGSMGNQSFTYDEKKSLSGVGYSWAGHTFLGWSTDANAKTATYGNGASVSNLTSTHQGAVTLYAIWKADSFALTVNPDNPNGSWKGSTSIRDAVNETGQATVWGDKVILGKADPADRSVTVTYNVNAPDATVEKADDVSKWVFDQWVVNNGAKGRIFNNSAGGNDNCYYILQNSNDTVTARYYYQMLTLPNATRADHVFLGWYYDAECTRKAVGRDGSTGNAGASFRPVENVTLYARWQKTSYTYSETMSAIMQDQTTGDTGVYIRKVDKRTLKPIVQVNNTGANIGIYKNGSVTDANLVLRLDTKNGVYDRGNNLVIPRSSANADGYYNITSYLSVGTTYVMHEIEAPEQYMLAEDVSFTYTGAGRVQVTMKDEKIFEPDTPGSYQLTVKKVNPDGDAVANAKFTLTDETAGTVRATFVSDENGMICKDLSQYLKAGHVYVLTETEAPEGYQLASPLRFTAPRNESEVASLPDFTIVDQFKRCDIVIRKENSSGTPLKGAVFQLFMKDEDGSLVPVYMDSTTNTYVSDRKQPNAVKAVVCTDGSGKAEFKGLPLRASYNGKEEDYTKSFYLKEIEAPDGYNPLPDIVEIRLPDDGKTAFTYTATDESIILTLETGGDGIGFAVLGGVLLILSGLLLVCFERIQNNQ